MQELLRILMQMVSNPVSVFTMLLVLFLSVIWVVHWLTKKFTRIDMTQQNFKQSLEVLTESVKDVKTVIVNLSVKMDKRFEKLEAEMDRQIHRLEAKTDEHFERVEMRIERVEMRIERVETTLAATREDVASLKAIAKMAMRNGIPVRRPSSEFVEVEMME